MAKSTKHTSKSMNKKDTPRSLLDQHANSLVEKLVECAMEGDLTALRICIERILPRAKPENGIDFKLPNGRIDSGDNMLSITNSITKAVSTGEMTIDEADKFTKFIRNQRRMIDESESKKKDEEWKKQYGL